MFALFFTPALIMSHTVSIGKTNHNKNKYTPYNNALTGGGPYEYYNEILYGSKYEPVSFYGNVVPVNNKISYYGNVVPVIKKPKN